jgi:hypothetical protein
MIDERVGFHYGLPGLELVVTLPQAPIYHLRDDTGDTGR